MKALTYTSGDGDLQGLSLQLEQQTVHQPQLLALLHHRLVASELEGGLLGRQCEADQEIAG